MCLWDDVQVFDLSELQTLDVAELQTLGGAMVSRTKQDTTGQVLAPEQVTCIMALVEGCTDEQASERAGVARSTLSRWKGEPAFTARLNAEIQAGWDAHRARLAALQGKALDVVAGALDSDDMTLSLKAAFSVLKLAGERPKGATSEMGVMLANWSPLG